MTIARISIGALALTLALGACDGGDANQSASAENNAPLEQVPAPNNGNWAEVVETTPEGGYRMGNPNAPVKLVEYASLTCPACKAFSDTGTAGLRDTYVASGQVSWEFRNFILGGPDLALSLLTRCSPTPAFFRTVEDIYTRQADFLQAIDEAEQQRILALPPEQQIIPLARAMDLDTYFARRGMPEARFNQCLGDNAAVEGMMQRTQIAGQQDDVRGTPTFIINGTKQDAASWAELEPMLRTALGR